MMKQVNIKIPFRMLALLLGLFLSVGAFAQITVKGHVKDSKGEDVIGATVRVAGTQTATVTDFDGNFVLKANQGATLSVSFVGYQTASVAAAPTVEVILQDDETVLNDVVVIGYGVAKKSDLTGSVSALKPDSKNKGVVVSAQDMLGGKVAGVNVTSYGGKPGGDARIRIRGGASLSASNDPLIVIDGVPMDNSKVGDDANPLATINPQDIETFNVLKDASATAIYGSRGSNGVIIITTKKGRLGQKKVNVSYAGSATVSMRAKSLDMMDAGTYRTLIGNVLGTESDAYSMLGTANTDWQKEIYRTALSHDHNITATGAVGQLPYRVSVGYTSQEGILKTSKYERFTGALNLNPSLLEDHLTLNLNAKGMYSMADLADEDAISAAVYFDPTQDPYSFTSSYHKNMLGSQMQQTLNNFGGFFEWPAGGAALNDSSWPYMKFKDATKNPLALLEYGKSNETVQTFVGSVDADYKVHGFEDLRLHATAGAEVAKGAKDNILNGAYPSDNGYYIGYTDNGNLKRNLLFNAYAQYYKDINKNNHFDIMAGYEWQHFYFSWDNSWKQYYQGTHNEFPGGLYKDTPDADEYESYLVSFFGRMNYVLANRYMLTATVRRDGSSRFAEHWSTFPSVALAWKIKEESFLKNSDAISDLKLRLGWGMTGQQDLASSDPAANNYIWIDKYKKGKGGNGLYPMVGDGTLYRTSSVNKDLKWETTTTYNAGLDLGFMDQRLTASIDYYYRNTKDLLNWAHLPALYGFMDEGYLNIGKMKNYGVEASISWKAVQTKDWFWSIDYNVTWNKNEITDLSGVSEGGKPVPTGDKIDISNKVLAHQVGYAANSFWVFQQAYDADGKPMENVVVDRDGDGQITSADKYLYKHIMAPVTMGLASRLEYKNWDLGFSLRASFGNYVYNSFQQGMRLTAPNALFYQDSYLANRITGTLGWNSDSDASKLTDYFVQNASFLKCDNITLGYSFDKLLKTADWDGLAGRVYATCSNVFTITKYDGIDPEVSSGIDSGMYPRPISFIVGLNLNF